MTKPIVVLGSLNMDLSIQSPKMPIMGETMHGSGFMTSPGGKGGNQAVAMARLGAAVYLIGCVGDDGFGHELLDSLRHNAVRTDCVRVSGAVSTGIAMIVIVAGNNSIILDAGANLTISPDDIRASAAVIAGSQLLAAQFEVPVETVRTAFKLARQLGVTTLLNPSPTRMLDEAFYRLIDILIVNEHEARDLTRIDVSGPEQAAQAIDWFRARGVRTPLVTLGRGGSVFPDGEEIRHCPIRPAEVVDTTGAGDTFLGALAVALINDRPLAEAVSWATAASSITVSRRGAQIALPSQAEVAALLASDV
jgi:ribokinase